MENTELATKTPNTKGIMRLEQADSPCKKIYFVLQLMYVFDEPHKLYSTFFKLVQDVQKAAPTTSVFISKVCESVLNDDYFSALEFARQLIGYEQKVISEAA